MNQLFSQRFKSARLLNGYSLQELADKLGNRVSRQALHKYEKGEMIPDSAMIGLLSDVLDVRPDFFFREMQVKIGPIAFRKFPDLPAKEEHRIIETVRDYLSRYLELEEIIGIRTEFQHPLEGFKEITCFQDVEDAAQEVRKKWALGCDPIYNAIELLEDKHIKIVEVAAGDSFDGMQTWVNGSIPVIAINKNRLDKTDRKRFTVMHELGHLLLTFPKEMPEKQQETFCHQFAGAILIPEPAMKEELGPKRRKLMVEELAALKQQYGVSIQAIAMRAKDLGIISDSYCRQFFTYIRQKGWKVNEPVIYEGREQSNRFPQLIFRALAEEVISIGQAASLANKKLADFKQNPFALL